MALPKLFSLNPQRLLMTHYLKILILVVFVLFAALTIAGCGNPSGETGKPPDTNDSDETDDSGNVPCVENPDFFQDLNLLIDERMASVATVTWASAEASTDHVVFGFPDSMSMTSPDELVPSINHQALLLGLKQGTEYAYQVVSYSSGNDYCSAVQTFSTGRLDAALPELILSISDVARSAGGYTMFSILCDENYIASIIDNDGNFVWAYDTQSDLVQRVRLSLDRKAVLYNNNNSADVGNATINRVSLDGLEVTQTSFPNMHHDFVETENGAYAALGWDIYTFTTEDGDRDICGDMILELAADGSSREVWNIFDWFEPDLTENYVDENCLKNPDAEDWSHTNSIWYEASENAYYITIRYLDKACKIDRSTGQLLWCVGGIDSDFTSIGEKSILNEPHSVLPVDGGLLIYENYDELAGSCAAGVMVSLDFESWTAQETWTYGTETCAKNMVFGNLEPLVNGNRMLVLSVMGQLDETTLDLETVWRVNAPVGYTFGFGERHESLY